MASVLGLYMEDYPEQFKQYGQMLAKAWEGNKALSELGELRLESLDRADSPSAAIDKLKQNGDKYAIFFADLLYHKEPSKRSSDLVAIGLDAVLYAAKHFPSLVIVAVSEAEQKTYHAGIRQTFLDYGGDVYFSKDQLLHSPDRRGLYSRIGKEIESALTKKKGLASDSSGVDIDYGSGDLTLEAEIDTIGDSVFKVLVKSLASDCQDFRIGHVDPGLSGASVFMLIGYNRKPFLGTTRHLFVKIAKDQEGLQREVSRVPPPGTLSPGVCPEPLRDAPVSAGGWFAIGYALLRDTKTLRSWLLDMKPNDGDVSVFLERLFAELLNLYRSNRPDPNRTAIDVLFPSKMVGSRAMLSMRDLWPLARKHLRDPLPDDALIKAFIREKKIGARGPDTVPPGTMLCDSHGDLHSRNILVGIEGLRPHLVDFSERGERHRALDFAQLCADLFVLCWDAGVSSQDCSNMEDWRQVIAQWLFSGGHGVAVSDANSSVWSCATQVRDKLKSVTAGVHGQEVSSWEFCLALVDEFVRLSGEISVPAPKRALALVAAHDILRRLEDDIPRRPHL